MTKTPKKGITPVIKTESRPPEPIPAPDKDVVVPPPLPLRQTGRTYLNIGISEGSLQSLVVLLNRALSSVSILLIKTKKFHWDIVGPQFIALHRLWEGQYETLTRFTDEIAERVRSRGGFPIGTATGFLEHSIIEEHPGVVASATEAVSALLNDHELIVRTLRTSIEKCVSFGDAGTADFLTGMLEEHEQMAWMNRSFLEGEAIHANGNAPPIDPPTFA